MSDTYAQALAAARRFIETEAPTPQLSSLEATIARRRTAWRRARVAVLGITAVIVISWIVSMLAHPVSAAVCGWVTPVAVARYGGVHVVGVVLGAGLAFVRTAGATLVSRAVFWSSTLVATAALILEPGTLPWLLPVMALGSLGCLALLIEPGPELGPPGSGFDLLAHRGAMSLVLILALADVETLMMAVVNHEEPGERVFAMVDGVCAVAMAGAVYGLYRMRAWGLVFNLVLNLVIAGLGLAGWLFYEPSFALLLVATAGLQLVLTMPLLLTLRRGRRGVVVRRRISTVVVLRWVLLGLLVFDVWAIVRAADPQVTASYCAE